MTLLVARVATAEAAERALRWGADAALVQDRFVWPKSSGPWAVLVCVGAGDPASAPRSDPPAGAIAGFREGVPDRAGADALRQRGYVGILLDRSQSLFQTIDPAEVARFADLCHATGLACGFAASEPPDLPRLLRLGPDFILVGDVLGGQTDLDAQGFALFRDLVAGSGSPASGLDPAAPPRPDRIFVRDLVLPMAIGAYSSEVGRTQRVRFSVEAEIASAPRPAHDMRDVVSYDLLSDAVRQVARSGHIAFVETVAERIAERVLAHPRVSAVRVTVEKLDLGPGSVGIEIQRARQSSTP